MKANEPEVMEAVPVAEEQAAVIEVLEERAVESAPNAPALTPEMAAMLAAMNQQTMAAVAELKRPDPEEQAKRDAERQRRIERAAAGAEAARREEVERKQQQSYCNHTKGNGMTAFVAQVNSDGCYRAFCPMCHYISAPIRAEEWQRTTEGLNMHKMRGITIPMLEQMAARSAPPLPLRRVPIGMVPDLSGV